MKPFTKGPADTPAKSRRMVKERLVMARRRHAEAWKFLSEGKLIHVEIARKLAAGHLLVAEKLLDLEGLHFIQQSVARLSALVKVDNA